MISKGGYPSLYSEVPRLKSQSYFSQSGQANAEIIHHIRLNYFHITMKLTESLRVYPGHPVPGGYKYEDLALQVGGVTNLRQ
jgi:hypothetical protein